MGESLSNPRSSCRVFPEEELLVLKIITPCLSHRPSSGVQGARSTSGSRVRVGVVRLISARGEAEVAAELGVQGLLPRRRAPVHCTSWSAPKRAAPVSAPRSQSRRPNSDASRSVCCRRAPARPLRHQRQVSLSWTAPALTPKTIHFAPASVAAPNPSPFPG